MTQENIIETADPSNDNEIATIWRAMDYHRESVEGFLVTAPGDINRPLAMVWIDSGNAEEWKTYARALEAALDPSMVWRSRFGDNAGPGVDLCAYGRLDSNEPMPAFIYSLACIPVDEEKANAQEDEKGDVPTLDVPHVEPRPWCKFMMANLSENIPR